MSLNVNKTYLGDCLRLMEDIDTGSIDMVLCDLPYGTTRCSWDIVLPFEILWMHYKRIVKHNGAICLFGAEPFASYLRMSNLKYYKYDWIWDKIKSSGFLNAKKRPLVGHENICVFYGAPPIYNYQKTFFHQRKVSKRKSHLQTEVYGKMKTNYEYDSTERYPRSIQSFNTDTQNSSLHPTQKPVSLCEYLINTYTNKGDTVLDNCAGSGTTGIACINTGRNYIMIEKEKKYYDIIQDRIANHKLKGIQNNLFDE